MRASRISSRTTTVPRIVPRPFAVANRRNRRGSGSGVGIRRWDCRSRRSMACRSTAVTVTRGQDRPASIGAATGCRVSPSSYPGVEPAAVVTADDRRRAGRTHGTRVLSGGRARCSVALAVGSRVAIAGAHVGGGERESLAFERVLEVGPGVREPGRDLGALGGGGDAQSGLLEDDVEIDAPE